MNTSLISPGKRDLSVTASSKPSQYRRPVQSTSIPPLNPVTMVNGETSKLSSNVQRSKFFSRESGRDDLHTIARIRSLKIYKDGWNGPDSVSPTRKAVEHAEAFARYLFRLGEIHVPYISASGDGEINFYWTGNGFTLDLGFTGDGYYSYYARLPDGGEIIEDEAVFDEPLPKEIITLVTKAV